VVGQKVGLKTAYFQQFYFCPPQKNKKKLKIFLVGNEN
jgi:hypothetical protein